jgi:hypothetical protein
VLGATPFGLVFGTPLNLDGEKTIVAPEAAPVFNSALLRVTVVELIAVTVVPGTTFTPVTPKPTKTLSPLDVAIDENVNVVPVLAAEVDKVNGKDTFW